MLDFSHRKDIVKRRILALGNLFSVGIYAYAVMSNHVHVVLTVQPDQANQWSTDEVVERWLGIRSGHPPINGTFPTARTANDYRRAPGRQR